MSGQQRALALAVAIVIVDQVTKVAAVELIDRPISLIDGFLGLRLTRNSGSAFSLFQGGGTLIAIIAFAVAWWLVRLIRRSQPGLEMVALSMILGGAVGNLVDRLVRADGFANGAVIDFVDLWVIPTFNVADTAITLGATLLVLLALTGRLSEEPAATTVP